MNPFHVVFDWSIIIVVGFTLGVEDILVTEVANHERTRIMEETR